MLRLAARYADSFDADYQTGPAPVLERLAGLEAACRDVGRDPPRIGRMAATRVALAGGSASGFQVGPAKDGIAQFDFAGVRFPARLGSVEEVAAHLRAFEAIGVGHLTVNVVDPPGVRGLERFAAVIEALRRSGPRSGDRETRDRAGEGVPADRQVEVALADRQAPRHAALEPRGQAPISFRSTAYSSSASTRWIRAPARLATSRAGSLCVYTATRGTALDARCSRAASGVPTSIHDRSAPVRSRTAIAGSSGSASPRENSMPSVNSSA